MAVPPGFKATVHRRQPPKGMPEVSGHKTAQYPFFLLPASKCRNCGEEQVAKHVRFEVRCAICHTGLCAMSEGVNTHELPCVFVPVCPACLQKLRDDPTWEPLEHLDFPSGSRLPPQSSKGSLSERQD